MKLSIEFPGIDSLKMNHIKQRAAYGDCGVAAIAMVTDVTYERVLNSVPPDVIPFGLWYAEVLHTLKKITEEEWSVKQFVTYQPRIRDYDFTKENCIYGLLIPEPIDAFHYIACDGIYFHDPLTNEKQLLSDLKDSKYDNWIIMVQIKK